MHYTIFFFFFFNDTATTEIYTLSLRDALPIYDIHPCHSYPVPVSATGQPAIITPVHPLVMGQHFLRSEEHTSELQSRQYLVCRLLLEKKKIRPYGPVYREETSSLET